MDSISTVTTQERDLALSVDSSAKTSAQYNVKDQLDHPTYLFTNAELFPTVHNCFPKYFSLYSSRNILHDFMGYTIKGDAREYKKSSVGGFTLLCSK